MVIETKPITILIADDNEIDRVMAKEALEQTGSHDDLHFVEDGEELLDYLRHSGKYADHKNAPLPGLILLDLKLPGKDGYEVLEEIKTDLGLREIPIMVISASKADEDRLKTYDMDASCFISKPESFDALVGLMRSVRWWADQS